jgi:hypothetical protein
MNSHPNPPGKQGNRFSTIESDRKSLHWASWDPSKVVTSLAQTTLKKWAEAQNVAFRWTPINLLDRPLKSINLVLWVVSEAADIDRLVGPVGEFRRSGSGAIHIAYLGESCIQYAGVMVESGVQIIVQPLHRLPVVLQKVLPRTPLSTQTSTILLSGLTERIPWSLKQLPSQFR